MAKDKTKQPARDGRASYLISSKESRKLSKGGGKKKNKGKAKK